MLAVVWLLSSPPPATSICLSTSRQLQPSQLGERRAISRQFHPCTLLFSPLPSTHLPAILAGSQFLNLNAAQGHCGSVQVRCGPFSPDEKWIFGSHIQWHEFTMNRFIYSAISGHACIYWKWMKAKSHDLSVKHHCCLESGIKAEKKKGWRGFIQTMTNTYTPGLDVKAWVLKLMEDDIQISTSV